MSPQPHAQNTPADSTHHHRTSTTRATPHGDHSRVEDARAARRFQSAAPTPFPISETAVSQADGEA